MAEKTNITKDTPPETIERDIARTREKMSGTVSEIKERLSPTHFKEEAKGKIRETARDTASKISQTARGAGSSILDMVRTYPVPIAMIGIGVTWLVFTRSSAKQKTLESTAAIREKAGEFTDKAQAKAEALSGQFREKGSQFAGRAKESAQKFGRAAQQSAWGAKNSLQEMINKNPLGISLAAFGIGALIGFSIPESRKEKEMMGSASESLLSRAKETAEEEFRKTA